MSLTREGILGYVDDRIGKVDIPKLGGEVHVAILSVAEADKVKSLGQNGVPAVTELVILGACDADGKRLFTDKDVGAIGKLPAKELSKIANAVLAHNGLTAEAAEETKND